MSSRLFCNTLYSIILLPSNGALQICCQEHGALQSCIQATVLFACVVNMKMVLYNHVDKCTVFFIFVFRITELYKCALIEEDPFRKNSRLAADHSGYLSMIRSLYMAHITAQSLLTEGTQHSTVVTGTSARHKTVATQDSHCLHKAHTTQDSRCLYKAHEKRMLMMQQKVARHRIKSRTDLHVHHFVEDANSQHPDAVQPVFSST